MLTIHKPALALILITAGCAPAAQTEVSYPLRIRGTPARQVVARDGWLVTLSQARLALGPLYLCASEGASAELCEDAMGEMRTAVAADALRADPQELATIQGVTGEVRSVAADFAITWPATLGAARALAAAPDGHSLVLEGRASKDGKDVDFRILVDVTPREAGTLSLQGHRVRGTVSAAPGPLLVTVDPNSWVQAVDFEGLSSPPGAALVLDASSRAANAVTVALTATQPPAFTW